MTQQVQTDRIVWSGRPWILPGVAWRTFQVVFVGVILFALEIFLNVAGYQVVGVPLINWTALVVAIAWVLGILHLFLLRVSHQYILREDSLEIRSGILTSRTSVISPSGFSDLEVIQSISGRIIGSGSIVIRTQSETRSERRMVSVRHPGRVANDIRGVMARPIVRVENRPEDKNT